MPSQLSCCTLFLRSRLKRFHLKGGNHTAYRNYGVEITGSCLRGDQPHHDFLGWEKLNLIVFCCYSVTKSYTTLCDPMDCSTPDFPVIQYLPEFAKLISFESMVLSNYLIPFSSCPQSFPSSGSFPMSWLFASGGQSIGAWAWASASVLPMKIQS